MFFMLSLCIASVFRKHLLVLLFWLLLILCLSSFPWIMIFSNLNENFIRYCYYFFTTSLKLLKNFLVTSYLLRKFSMFFLFLRIFFFFFLVFPYYSGPWRWIVKKLIYIAKLVCKISPNVCLNVSVIYVYIMHTYII